MKTFLAIALAACLTTGARAESETFLIYDFQFENGSVLPELRVAYETHGKLNAGRDNARVLSSASNGASTTPRWCAA